MSGSSATGPRNSKRIWFLVAAGIVLVAALALFAVVGNGPPSGAGDDPGNQHLHDLSSDPIFASLPPGAQPNGPIVQTPAQYRQPAFQGAGWDGPSVVRTFVSNAAPETVYQYYAAAAAQAGWQPQSQGANGYTDQWTKLYPDHARAQLALLEIGSSAKGRTYQLGGSA